MAVLAPTPMAMVSPAVSAKTGLFRSVRPANARSCNDILPPHSLAAVALGMLPPCFQSRSSFFSEMPLPGYGHGYLAQTRSRGRSRTGSRSIGKTTSGEAASGALSGNRRHRASQMWCGDAAQLEKFPKHGVHGGYTRKSSVLTHTFQS